MYEIDESYYDRLPIGPGWKLIGTLPVDAGCLVIIDPCYLLSASPTGGSNVDPYDEILDSGAGLIDDGYQSVGKDSGIVFNTGYGDGAYPMFARFDGGRVMEVRIIMD